MEKQKSQNIDFMNLSEKDFEIPGPDGLYAGDMAYHEEDIKEFIRQVKKKISELYGCSNDVTTIVSQELNRFAGDKLNGTKD